MTHSPTPMTFTLLRLLADGDFHSGEEMAEQLGISRASVNLALKEVEHLGLTLYRVRGRGYCLVTPVTWLEADKIAESLGSQRSHFALHILDCVTSTNTLLLQALDSHPGSGTVIAAEWQEQGRGRLGRRWHSGLGTALTFSVLWRFDQGMAALQGLSLAVGLSLLRTLHAMGHSGARLKWPNDLLDESGSKLAGILIETRGDMLGPVAAVIGIGLNVSMPEHLRHQIDRPSAGLTTSEQAAVDRNLLLAEVLKNLRAVLREFEQHGFAALRQEWEKWHAYQDRAIGFVLPDGRHLTGIARGVTDEGALLLEYGGETRIYHTGEISLAREAAHAAG